MKQLMTGIFVAALLPSLGFAEAMEQWKIDGKVERYTVHESPAQYGQGEGVFMFYLGDHKVLKGLSGCKDPSQPTVGFAIPLNTARGMATMSAIMSAKANDLAVSVQGNGSCNDWPDRMSVHWVQVR